MTMRLLPLLLALCLSAPVHADDSLYQDLGKREGIVALVQDTLARVHSDPRIAEFFKDIDEAQLRRNLIDQLCVLSGGPGVYKGKDMKTIHDGLKIRTAHFNALAEDLQMAMEARGIASAAQNRLIARLAPMRADIVEPAR